MNHLKRIAIATITLMIIPLTGCSSRYIPSSNQYAPIDLRDNSPTTRQLRVQSTIETSTLHYSWISESGNLTRERDVTKEINDYLGYGHYLDLPRTSAHDSSWYWSPNIDQSTQDTMIITRPDTLIILALNPTIVLRVNRQTEFQYATGGSPKYNSTQWWGWNRPMLSYGIANGLAIPTTNCSENTFPSSEIIIPSLNYEHPININTPGSLSTPIATIHWTCDTNNHSKILFHLDPSASDTME